MCDHHVYDYVHVESLNESFLPRFNFPLFKAKALGSLTEILFSFLLKSIMMMGRMKFLCKEKAISMKFTTTDMRLL